MVIENVNKLEARLKALDEKIEAICAQVPTFDLSKYQDKEAKLEKILPEMVTRGQRQ